MDKIGMTRLNYALTGASSGIGAEFLQLIEPSAASVISFGRTKAFLKSPGSRHIHLDLSKPVENQLKSHQFTDPIDCLVLCAGSDVGGRTPFGSQTFSSWENTIHVNFTRSLELIHLLLPRLLQSKHKTILALTSSNLKAPPKGCLAYTSAKAALSAALQTLRLEYSEEGLRVIEVIPGITRTNFAYNRLKDRAAADKFYDGFQRTLSPSSVAKAMEFLILSGDEMALTHLEIQPPRESK